MATYSDIYSYDFGSFSDGDWDDMHKDGSIVQNAEDIDITELGSGDIHWQEKLALNVDIDKTFPLYVAVSIRTYDVGSAAIAFRFTTETGTPYYSIGTINDFDFNTDLDIAYEEATSISSLITTSQFRATEFTYAIDGDGDGDYVWVILKFNTDGTIDLYKYKNNAFANNGDISSKINDFVLVQAGIDSANYAGDLVTLDQIDFFGEGDNVPTTEIGFGKIQVFQKTITYFDLDLYDIPIVNVTNSINIGGSGYMELVDHEREHLSTIRASNREVVSISEGRHNNVVYRGEIGKIQTKGNKIVIQLKDYLKKLNRINVNYNPIVEERYIRHIGNSSKLYFPNEYTLSVLSITKPVVIVRNNLTSQKIAAYQITYEDFLVGELAMTSPYGVVNYTSFYNSTFDLTLAGVGAYNENLSGDFSKFRIIADFKIIIPTGATINKFVMDIVYRTGAYNIDLSTVPGTLDIYDYNLAAWEELAIHIYTGAIGDSYNDEDFTPISTHQIVKSDDDEDVTAMDYFTLIETDNAFGKDVYTLRVAVMSGQRTVAGDTQAVAAIDYAILNVDFNIPHADVIGINTLVSSLANHVSSIMVTMSNNNIQDSGYSIGDLLLTSEYIDDVLANAFNSSDVSNFISTININFTNNNIVEHESLNISFLSLLRRYGRLVTIIYWYDPYDNSLNIVDTITSSTMTFDKDDTLNYPNFDFEEDSINLVSAIKLVTPAGTYDVSFIPEYISGAESEIEVVDNSEIETSLMLIDAGDTLKTQFQYSVKILTIGLSLNNPLMQSYIGIRLGQSYAIRYPTAATPTVLDFSASGEGEMTLVSMTYIRTKNTDTYILKFERLYL